MSIYALFVRRSRSRGHIITFDNKRDLYLSCRDLAEKSGDYSGLNRRCNIGDLLDFYACRTDASAIRIPYADARKYYQRGKKSRDVVYIGNNAVKICYAI